MYAEFPRLDPDACRRTIHVVDERGRIHAGGDAFREVMERVGAPLAYVLRIAPARQITELVYRVVAANRRWIPL